METILIVVIALACLSAIGFAIGWAKTKPSDLI